MTTHGNEFNSPQFWKEEFFTLGLARPAGAGHKGGPRNKAGARSQIKAVLGPDTRAAGDNAGRGTEKFQALVATIELLAPGVCQPIKYVLSGFARRTGSFGPIGRSTGGQGCTQWQRGPNGLKHKFLYNPCAQYMLKASAPA